MVQWSADEAIVAMKRGAYESVVTHLRIKLLERDKRSKAKGGTCEEKRIVTQILKLLF